ncbi:ejaculatory bulb-specific protein 3-like [Orussus abietinus]|uniref:ejaculatory bulb-specific protein 3-like n=1 Tax=Orussus abietinus TaxID=222816 RepID=UPI0006251E35|nr:ejaculatory bulb-specific protein 3-like [Orussus abietinus]
MEFGILLGLLLIGSGMILAEDSYSTMYDHVNVEAILFNERVFKQYMACLLDRGPCTPEAHALRNVLPDALATNCIKCNNRQKEIAKTVMAHLRYHRPEVWDLFVQKYDPEEVYVESFAKFLEEDR